MIIKKFNLFLEKMVLPKFNFQLNENLNKETFYKIHNINSEKLSYLGTGEFGKAYSIGDGRVLKITSSNKEFELAKELLGKNNFPILNGIVDFYAADIVDGDKTIIMEELEEDFNIENLYYELCNMLEEQELSIQYSHLLDIDNFDISEELSKFIDDINDINRAYRYLGIEASDISPDNLGVDKNGKIKAFDIDDKNKN